MISLLKQFILVFIVLFSLPFTASFASNNETVWPPGLSADMPLCPNYTISKNSPPLPPLAQHSFKHYRNYLLSLFFEPHHVVFDEIFNPSDTISIVGKFDYDWLLHKDLKDEWVHAYIYDGQSSNWRYLGKYQTNKNGEVTVPLHSLPAGNYHVKMVVEGDLSQVDGYLSVINPNQEAIVFDIDGTLTLSDFEMLKEFLKIATASPYSYAKELVEFYRDKNYQLIFLTARPYWMTRATRHWLENIIENPAWVLHTKKSLFGDEVKADPLKTEKYKADYLKTLIDKGIIIKRAYGNAKTDIGAYEKVGVNKKDTYIIGPNAGDKDTQPIHGDYYAHYQAMLAKTNKANCR